MAKAAIGQTALDALDGAAQRVALADADDLFGVLGDAARREAVDDFLDAGRIEADLAWSYDFPTRQLLPIAGLVAFYNEKVDLTVDGVLLERPATHFS